MVARDQAELIVPALRHPDRQRVLGYPDTPGELQASLCIKRYGEHEDACQEQQQEGPDQLEERFEVTAFYRVVKPRRPGIQADLDRNLRNRQGRDQCQTAAIHPFVLRRPEGQGKTDKTPEKADVIQHSRLGAGTAGHRILHHGSARLVPRSLAARCQNGRKKSEHARHVLFCFESRTAMQGSGNNIESDIGFRQHPARVPASWIAPPATDHHRSHVVSKMAASPAPDM